MRLFPCRIASLGMRSSQEGHFSIYETQNFTFNQLYVK